MATAPEHQQRLENDGLLKFEASVSTVAEAKILKKDISLKQKWLRAAKREINIDMKAIRSNYRNKATSAGLGGSTIFSLFGKRGLAGQWMAAAKANQRSERDAVLMQYENVKSQIDEALLQMDRVKLQIDEYIQQNKDT